jgi:hypothetical protein
MALSSSTPRQLREHPGAAPGRLPLQRQPEQPPAQPAERALPAVLPIALPPAPLDGLGQVTALVRDGFAGLATTHRSPRRSLLWAFWLTGIIGDGATTLAMISSGQFAEGNPAAAIGMGFLGLTGYVVLASVICLVMATISTGRPTGPVARVAVGFLLLVGAGKLAMALSNLTLWASLR